MKRKIQGYDARLDESLGMRHRGPKKQSMMSRRHESEEMERHYGKCPYSSDMEMDRGMKMNHSRRMMRRMRQK